MKELLNSPESRAILLVVVPILLFCVRLITKSEGPTLWPLLPRWCDITTWPNILQPVIPFLLGALPLLYTDLQAGVAVLVALGTAAKAGFAEIGLYTGAKKAIVLPFHRKPKPTPIEEPPPVMSDAA